ncbi:MAG: carboxylesterase family protein [Lachnospiraceae bacterium]|nr:carboxylesterase family protein [Lachnospiraceae bacterium]
MALMEVKTDCGLVRGARGNNRGFTVFRGIPYGKPPVGALRFAPPQKREPWEGVLDCTRFEKTCMQTPESFGLYVKEFYPEPKNMGEDCLYLNIWTPADSSGQDLPVLLWIHGGAYLGGYSYEQEFDGEAMCKRGCILVSIEYRCNAFGFFGHPELTKRNGRCGSAGMEDQILALQWVHENIAAFGGSPENITVFGQSAGAMSTRTLLTSPRCRGLIRHAIIQSGGGINDWSEYRTMEAQEQLGIRLLEQADMTFEEVMTLPEQEVYERLDAAMSAVMGGPCGDLGFHPCIDGYNLVEYAGQSIKEGRMNCDSILCGGVAGDVDIICQFEEDEPDQGQKKRVAAYSAANALGDWMAKSGRRRIYTYYFDHALPGDGLGSWHSCELWYMFGTMARCWRPWKGYDYVLSDATVDYWCNFAKSGDPNGPGLPDWSAYTCEKPETMCFSDAGFGMKNLNLEPYAEEFKKYFQQWGMVRLPGTR